MTIKNFVSTFIAIFDLRLSIVFTFSITAYPVWTIVVVYLFFMLCTHTLDSLLFVCRLISEYDLIVNIDMF